MKGQGRLRSIARVSMALVLAVSLTLVMALPVSAAAPTIGIAVGGGIDGQSGTLTASGTEAGAHAITVTDATASTLTGGVAEHGATIDTMANALVGDETLSVTIAGEAIITGTLTTATAGVTTLAAVATDIQTLINAELIGTTVTVTATVTGGAGNDGFVITVDEAGANNSITTQVTGTNGGETETGLGGQAPVAGTDADAVDVLTPATGSNGLWQADASYGNGSATMTIAHSPAAGTASDLAGLEPLVETASAFIEGITLDASAGLSAGTATVTVTAGTAGYLEVTGTASMTAGGSNELTVTAYDDADNRATAYVGSKNLTYSGPLAAPDATDPTVEATVVGLVTATNFTAGVSDANVATLIAYKAEVTTVDVGDGAIDSTADPTYDLDLTVNLGALDAYTVVPAALTQTADTAFNVAITAVDQFENPRGAAYADDTPYTWVTNAAGTPVIGTLAFGDFAAGVATKAVTLVVAESGVTFTATGTSTSTGTSAAITVNSGAPPPPAAPLLLPTETPLSATAEGVTTTDRTAESQDGSVALSIPAGTSVTVDGLSVTRISIVPVAEVSAVAALAAIVTPAAAAVEAVVIGSPVDLGPDGVLFDPPITLTFTYDGSLLYEGVDESNLSVAWWDADTGTWVVLEGATVDPVARTVSVPASHFTEFIVIAPLLSEPAPEPTPPADEEEVAPPADEEEVAPPADEEEVAPSADEEEVAPPADEEEVAPPADEEEVAPSADEEEVPPSADEEEVAPPTSEPEPTPPAADEEEEAGNTALIIGIIAGVVVVVALGLFFWRRRAA